MNLPIQAAEGHDVGHERASTEIRKPHGAGHMLADNIAKTVKAWRRGSPLYLCPLSVTAVAEA